MAQKCETSITFGTVIDFFVVNKILYVKLSLPDVYSLDASSVEWHQA